MRKWYTDDHLDEILYWYLILLQYDY